MAYHFTFTLNLYRPALLSMGRGPYIQSPISRYFRFRCLKIIRIAAVVLGFWLKIFIAQFSIIINQYNCHRKCVVHQQQPQLVVNQL